MAEKVRRSETLRKRLKDGTLDLDQQPVVIAPPKWSRVPRTVTERRLAAGIIDPDQRPVDWTKPRDA